MNYFYCYSSAHCQTSAYDVGLQTYDRFSLVSARDGEPVDKPRKVGYLFSYLNMFDKRIRRDYNCTNTGQINN